MLDHADYQLRAYQIHYQRQAKDIANLERSNRRLHFFVWALVIIAALQGAACHFAHAQSPPDWRFGDPLPTREPAKRLIPATKAKKSTDATCIITLDVKGLRLPPGARAKVSIANWPDAGDTVAGDCEVIVQ